MSEQRDYRDTVFLPKTDFPMKAGLPAKEPGIQSRWQDEGLYRQVRESRAGLADLPVQPLGFPARGDARLLLGEAGLHGKIGLRQEDRRAVVARF